jgi:Raf kinase inhibitor-like YbhB/YbcL family protein
VKKIFAIFIIIVILAIIYFALIKQRSENFSFKNMKISSPNFSNNEFIPVDFTCDGKDINPEIYIDEVPENTLSLVLIVDDPDAPMGVWTHWTMWNIPPQTKIIKQGSLPEGAVEGITSFGKPGWGGPCPPQGKPHRYFFKIFALDKKLDLSSSASRNDLEKAMEGHILDKAEFFGLYKR